MERGTPARDPLPERSVPADVSLERLICSEHLKLRSDRLIRWLLTSHKYDSCIRCRSGMSFDVWDCRYCAFRHIGHSPRG